MSEASPDRALDVELRLHLDRQPLSGRLRSKHGVEETFVGWLGFVEALRTLQDLGDSPPSRSSSRSPTAPLT
jgi:hypothetical protein